MGRRRRAKRARTPKGHRDIRIGRRGYRWRDWANGLSAGPAGLIAERVLSDDVAGYVRFRAVCRAWRAATADPARHSVLDRRFHPRRWIMLPRAFHIKHRRPFLNVSSGESIHVCLPDLYRRHHLFGRTAEGLLVVCRKDTDALAVQLLNPLTGQRADLPPATTLLTPLRLPSHHRSRRRLNSIRVGSAGLAGDSTMVALHYGDSGVAVARPGDKRWTKLEPVLGLKSALSFAGRFYCVTPRNILVVETMENGQQPQLKVAVDFKPDDDNALFTCKYADELQLVDNGGELLLVHCAWQPQPMEEGHCCSGSGKYAAYQVELDTGNIVPTHGLGGRTLFIGMRHSLSMHRRGSRYMSKDTVYMCCNYSDVTGRRPNSVVAIDLFGRCFKPSFSKEDIAHYLSSYVCA